MNASNKRTATNTRLKAAKRQQMKRIRAIRMKRDERYKNDNKVRDKKDQTFNTVCKENKSRFIEKPSRLKSTKRNTHRG